MKERLILIRAVEAISFLFAAFSGFLTSVAPPESTEFSVGVGSILALCIYLLLTAVSKKRLEKAERRLWIGLGGVLAIIAAAAAMAYLHNRERLTFQYPPENPRGVYIAGTQYTKSARELMDTYGLSPAEALLKFGGLPNRHYVWTQDSIDHAQIVLVANYLVFVLSFAGAVFSLVEVKTNSATSRARR